MKVLTMEIWHLWVVVCGIMNMIQYVDGQIKNKTCDGSYECFQKTMVCDATTEQCIVQCGGAYACSEAIMKCAWYPTNIEDAICKIYCTGLYGCKDLHLYSNRSVIVECSNDQACQGLVVDCYRYPTFGNSTLKQCNVLASTTSISQQFQHEKNILLSDVSSESLNNAFGIIFLVLLVVISGIMIQLYRLNFYISPERFVSVPSILWFQCLYECIICFVMGANETYLSNPRISPGVVIYTLLVPSMLDLMLVFLCILYSHDKFAHVPILGRLTCRQPILYPYRIGLISCVMWVYFLLVVLPVSLTGSDKGHTSADFVAAHVIIISVTGCVLTFILLAAFLSHVQRSYHDISIMRWLVLSSFLTVMLFLMQMLCGIEVHQDKADEVRAIQLLLEVLTIFTWGYIFPSLCLWETASGAVAGGVKHIELMHATPAPITFVEVDGTDAPTHDRLPRTLSIDEMFTGRDITLMDVICCVPNRKFKKVASQSYRGDRGSPRSPDSLGSPRSGTGETSVMEDLQSIDMGVNVEVMEDANFSDVWLRGVVSMRNEQMISVDINGPAPVITPPTTESQEERKIDTASTVETLSLDLSKEAYRIRLQLFGVEPVDLKRKAYMKYEVELPCILIDLREKLFELKGHLVENIFQINPTIQQVNEYRHAICQGRFDSYDYTQPQFSVHVLPYFIKVWFRELPDPILNTLSDPSVMDFILHDDLSAEAMPQICAELPPVSRALLYWLFDLCADIAKHEAKNKMNIKSLAVEVAPNLYRVQPDRENVDTQLHPKLAQFCVVGIQWRNETRDEKPNNSTPKKTTNSSTTSKSTTVKGNKTATTPKNNTSGSTGKNTKTTPTRNTVSHAAGANKNQNKNTTKNNTKSNRRTTEKKKKKKNTNKENKTKKKKKKKT